MTLDEITAAGINPALALLPKRMDTPAARVMLLAIGLQESRFTHRWQVVDTDRPELKGPARGFWECEAGTVRLVLIHKATSGYLAMLCLERACAFEHLTIWQRIETDDVLAAGLARLLLWADVFPLPQPEQSDAAWQYYLRVWNPGRPHPKTWPDNHAAALAAVFKPQPAAINEDDL